MITLLTFLLLAAQSFTASANFAFDLDGPVDHRAGTWGTAQSATKYITFAPPPGYRVRILRVSGDLVAWPQVLLTGENAGVPIKAGRYAGVLLGLGTTAPEGSIRGDWMADNTFLYIQAGLDAVPVRAPFNRRVSALLEPDNKMAVKVASWLNTTGVPIHIEPTLTFDYKFEKDQPAIANAIPAVCFEQCRQAQKTYEPHSIQFPVSDTGAYSQR